MSTAKPKPSSANKPKIGSSFKVPGSRKASTPLAKDEKNVTMGSNLSVILPPTVATQRARHQPLPGAKNSTPTKEEKDITLTCDISAIRPSTMGALHGNHQPVLNARKALYKTGHDSSNQAPSSKMSKQMELDMAYNNYLLAVAHNSVQERHYADNKAQIEADLGALTKRLAVNQLNLENTKQRISEISFLSERDRLLTAQKEGLTETLSHVEGAAGKNISGICAAIDAKADNLEMRNIAIGTAELKRILADSNRILSQLRAANPTSDNAQTLAATDCLKDTTAAMRVVNARQDRVAKKLPAYQGAAIIQHTVNTFNAEQTQDNDWILREDDCRSDSDGDHSI